MNFFSKIANMLSTKKSSAIVSQESIVLVKTSLSKVKTGDKVCIHKNQFISYEGCNYNVRSYSMPQDALTVVGKQLQKRSPRLGGPQILVKLEDSKGNRYNLKGSTDSKLQMQKTIQG